MTPDDVMRRLVASFRRAMRPGGDLDLAIDAADSGDVEQIAHNWLRKEGRRLVEALRLEDPDAAQAAQAALGDILGGD